MLSGMSLTKNDQDQDYHQVMMLLDQSRNVATYPEKRDQSPNLPEMHEIEMKYSPSVKKSANSLISDIVKKNAPQGVNFRFLV